MPESGATPEPMYEVPLSRLKELTADAARVAASASLVEEYRKALRSERERRLALHRALAGGCGVEDGGEWEDRAVAAESLAEEKETENEKLREALHPFAAFADRLDDDALIESWADDEFVDTGLAVEGRDITVGEFRRARAALASSPPRDQGESDG